MIKKIDHLGIAVKNLEESIKFYEEVFKLKCEGVETVADQKVKTAFFTIGDVHIELLEPMEEESAVGKFIAKNGEGIHHIAYEVDSVVGGLEHVKNKGVRLIDEKPRKGAHNKGIAFLHPKSTQGVLTEFCQECKNCEECK